MSSSIDSSILIGFLVTLCSLIAFVFLQKIWNPFYAPKKRESHNAKKYNAFINWIPETWNGTDEEFLSEKGGADIVLYLRFMRYSFVFFLVLTILGCAILIPINYQGENRKLDITDPLRTTDLNVVSLANISQGSKWLYAHVVSTYVFTLCIWVLMYKLYQSYVEVTNKTRRIDNITNRTIMVRGTPNAIHSSEDLLRLFIAFYGNHVTAAYLVPKLSSKLHKLLLRREDLMKKYRLACDYYKEHKFDKRLKHKVYKKKIKHHRCWKLLSCLVGGKVDSIEQYSKEIKETEERITKLQEQHHKNTKVGFVTFTSVSFAMQCTQIIHSRRPKVLEVRMAPDPNGILWKDLHWGFRARFGRELAIAAALVGLFLFWSIPVTFISAFSNLSSLAKLRGFDFLVSFLDKNQFIKSFLDGWLPSLALNIFMALLPAILTYIIKLRAWYLRRELEVRVLITYWTFLLLNVFLVSTIAGSIFQVLEDFISTPVSLVNLLSNSLPSQAIFFTNYIITDSFTTFTLNELVRLKDFLITMVKRRIAKTKKAKEDLFEKQNFDFHLAYAEQLLILAIAFCYSSMGISYFFFKSLMKAPIILPFAAIYFVIAYSVAKYNFMHVTEAEYEGVKMTRAAIDIIFIIALIYQLTTAGALGAKGFAPATSVFFLIPATFIFRWRLANRFFMYSKYLPLEECPFPDNSVSHEITNSPYPFAHPELDTLEPIDGSEEYKETMKRKHHRQAAAFNLNAGISQEIDIQFSENSSMDRSKLMKEEQSHRRLTLSLPENLQAIPGLNRVTNTVNSGIHKATNILDELLIV